MAYRTLHQLQASGRRASARRGAVLLIVLTLLVLFVLIGITFVLVATRYYGGAKQNAKVGEQGDHSRKLLEETIRQVLVGPVAEQNGNVLAPYSCLWNQDLLGDLYNKDGVLATVTGAAQTPNTGGQFFSIGITTGPPFSLSPEAGEYVGRVLTILSGDAVGISTRITGYTSGGGNSGTMTVEALKSERVPLVSGLPAGTRVLINGAAFNGTGAGFDLVPTGLPDPTMKYQRAMAYGFEAALMPNFSRYDNTQWNNIRNFQVNEPYDAVDFQNMYLAMISSQGIIPSFHRPDLIQYWMTRGNWGDQGVRARVMFRPDDTIHANFSGSNPSVQLPGVKFNPVTGPWDIDNDGDGIADSIWIDIGLPARAGADGRMYKPLVAVLIQDLDGRFDVNAHGSLAQLRSGGNSLMPVQQAIYAGTPGPSTPALKRGVGYGPAGIDFRHAVNNYPGVLSGRYKDPSNTLEPTPVPGDSGYDKLSFLKEMGVPINYNAGASGSYGSPSDVFDQGAVGVDVLGHPIYQHMATTDETFDDPYEINPRRGIEQGTRATDALYSLTELEALLRRYDADAAKLPQRLRNLVGDQNSRIVTVLSSHVGVNAGMLPPSRRGSENHLHRLMEDYGITDPAQLVELLPFEVLKGGKMNLNRRWGNGMDDDDADTNAKNGIIDDPNEKSELAWGPGSASLPGYANPRTNYTNFGVAAANAPIGIRAKQLYAKQLYVLAMALSDPGALLPTQEVGLNAGEYRARRIAQWAINCVDYRDPDSIMTPFEYDADLSGSNGGATGWQQNIDDNPGTDEGGDRRLVWGCEFPDLLLTEATAFHDKRLKDTSNDADAKKLRKSTDMNMQDDEDLDQWRVPQGSLFLELYCPRAPHSVGGMPGGNPVLPRELYNHATHLTSPNKLDLGRTHNNGPTGHPVWRIAISEPQAGKTTPVQVQSQNPESAQFQPEALVIPNLGATPASLIIQRVVFFTNGPPTITPDIGDVNKVFWRRGGGEALGPGQYAVVGPRATTRLGVLKDGTDTTVATLTPQRISLTATSVEIYDANGVLTPNPAPTNVVGIICGANPTANFPTTGGMNISEPMPQSDHAYGGTIHADAAPIKTLYAEAGVDGYYDPANPDATMPAPDGPFDYKAGRPLVAGGVTASGTHVNHRTAFLQRLADPTQPFSATNPYVTIDWKPIDLTVFNGEDKKPDPFPAGVMYDAQDNNADWSSPPKFGTRQSICTNDSIWTQTTVQLGNSTAAGSTAYFDYNLQPTPTQGTLGTLNRPMTLSGAPFPYNNAAQQAFPWLNIANRPFISAYELLQVPASAPNRLLHEFTMGNMGGDPYNGTDVANSRAPYAHLLNFLRTSPAATGGAMPAAASNLHRIFDYVEVASPYSGTENWYNADVFGNAPPPPPPGGTTEFYRPPFNYMSKFQDPGLVNINTIFEGTIWDGGNGVSGVGGGRKPLWNNVRVSRQGYADGNDAQYPSKFSNPFRPGWAADLVPLDNMSHPEVDVTLLRRPTPGGGNVPLFAETTTNPYEAVERHSHFRYEPLVAIGNRVKFTSNVFAIWTTVGFFEVQAVAPSQAIPDGWQLGAELGVETGEITRHRAFYIIDRSIPVAYQPGEAHNTERCILLRRYLE